MIEFTKYNVLAVDDVPLNLLLVEKMLAKFKFRIRKASGGRQAMEEISLEKPDLVISTYSTTIIQDYYPIFDFE